jgi:hypothetical protein
MFYEKIIVDGIYFVISSKHGGWNNRCLRKTAKTAGAKH